MYGHYVAIDAQQFSNFRKARPRKPRKMSRELWENVRMKLVKHWSPETIVGKMRRDGLECVSTEWIYHMIRLDKTRGGNLYTYLPHHMKHRKRPVSSAPIKDRMSIEERTAAVNEKKRFGDWEMDTIIGKDGKGAILTLVERTTKNYLWSNVRRVRRQNPWLVLPYNFWLLMNDTYSPSLLTTAPSSLNINASHGRYIPRCSLLIHTRPGRRDS